ncbi:hypothetical protein [Nonomuraea insulae]|uniref:Secreted protein n=1 Tax=Nonomuraea insulae TaxID=1616787 RepID=A0ABW1CJ70_9ACTN
MKIRPRGLRSAIRRLERLSWGTAMAVTLLTWAAWWRSMGFSRSPFYWDAQQDRPAPCDGHRLAQGEPGVIPDRRVRDRERRRLPAELIERTGPGESIHPVNTTPTTVAIPAPRIPATHVGSARPDPS